MLLLVVLTHLVEECLHSRVVSRGGGSPFHIPAILLRCSPSCGQRHVLKWATRLGLKAVLSDV